MSGGRGHEDDTTEEELNRVIAEQLENLPDWWHEDSTREDNRYRNAAICKLRKQGWTVEELACEFRLTRKRISKILVLPAECERQRRLSERRRVPCK